MSTINEAMTGHDLIGVSAGCELCSCGSKQPSFIEHAAEIALDSLLGLDASATAEDLARTRKVLAERAAEQEQLGRDLAATGLAGFVERSEWLIAHRSPLDRLAWDLKWARLGLPAPYLPAQLQLRSHRGGKRAPVIPHDRQLQIAIESANRRAAHQTRKSA
jgi:hypothetical protein